MKPKLKPPGTECLKVKWEILLSIFAFNFSLRRYDVDDDYDGDMDRATAILHTVGRCRSTLSNPRWKRRELSA